jgi:hypothetical protein
LYDNRDTRCHTLIWELPQDGCDRSAKKGIQRKVEMVSLPYYAAKRGQVALADGLRQEFAGTKFRSIIVNPPYLDDARPDRRNGAKLPGGKKGSGPRTGISSRPRSSPLHGRAM